MHQHERHLTDRDHRIVEFLVRYRVGTNGLVRRACFESGATDENVRRVLRRIEQRQLLRRVTSAGGLSYCVPTRRSLELAGESPRTPRPLTEQTLPALLAVAHYCVGSKAELLTRTEFIDLYPELWREGMRASSYTLRDTDGKLRLEMLLVDRGGAAHRITARVRRIIAQRNGLPKFAALISAGRFQVTLLTGAKEQADKVARRVSRRPFGPVEVSTCVIPELADYLLRRR